METIEEHSKLESSGSMSPQSQKELRICLVGDVVYDAQVVDAAKSLKIPMELVEGTPQLINESKWLTFFVLKDFDGTVFEEIHRSKQCVLGPPALKQIVAMSHNLIPNARPLYNYSMRGVVTCFTGIRKKDELTRLVTLIHAMGGCIRKDMNSKITHLISNHSSGEKYRYAKTFRLTVVRPDWVYAAWERRDEVDFQATSENFSHEYKLKPFEGQKICFFGFPPDEHQHMVDVLLTNGGITTELDDPECSHVVMPSNVGFLPNTEILCKSKPNKQQAVDALVDVVAAAAGVAASKTTSKDEETKAKAKADDNNAQCTELERIALTYDSEKSYIANAEEEGLKTEISRNEVENIDGIVLETEKDKQKFQLDISYISPILANNCIETKTIAADTSTLSEKKPKFLRTGSIARKIRYSMTVVAENTPFLKGKIQRRRSSLCMDNDSFILNETATSNASLAMLSQCETKETPFNESKRNAKKDNESFKIKTPIARILRSRRNNTKFPTKDAITTTTTNESFSLKKPEKKLQQTFEPPGIGARKRRRHSEESDKSRNLINEISPTSSTSSSTPKLRVLRPRRCVSAAAAATTARNRTISCTTYLQAKHNLLLNEDQLKNQVETFSQSKSDLYENEDFFVYDDPDDDTIDSSQLSFASQLSKKSKLRLGGDTMKRTIRRSIHYVSEKTPLSKILRRSQRGSITSMDACNLNISEISSTTAAEHPNKRARMEFTVNASEPEFKTPKIPQKLSNSSAAALIGCSTTPTSSKQITTTKQEATTTSASTAAATSNLITTNISDFVQEKVQIQQVSKSSIVATSAASSLNLHKTIHASANNGTETVVDEHSTQIKPNPANVNTHILKSDWFWYTIQNGYADETDYLFGDYLDSIANTPDTDRRESLPISLNKRKRKRFSQRLQFEGSPLGVGKRRSSISDAVYSSFSDSFLDCTTSPDTSKIYLVEPESSVLEAQTPAKKSLRFYHFMDFVNTESNYVGILDTIVKLFKIPLEEMAENGDGLLNNTEIKGIFGNFLSIHEVHQRMLERLRGIQNKWCEDCLIGDIILELKDELIRSYPPYINFFESMKEMLAYCDSQNPRFHAFLKINQTKPECGRQSLQDLMIRPVQRLPSISLLLNDILKHTAKSNPDYVKLEESLRAIKEVMTYINEDKRKTESRVAIFDIFNDIEGCPAHLVSSNRSFISKCETVELSDELSGRGDALMFYLFSDTIEVCKKRSRGFNTAKSPGSAQKTFKHVKLLPLNAIRFVIDITDSPRAFALLCRQDKDKLYSFTIVDEEIDKIVYIKTLCKQMAQHACRADSEKSLLYRTSQELDVDISNVNLSTLSKAFKLAARTRLKVGRAFSFNKTPSKLKRAVSTMMTSPFGSTNALTPASQLAQMRLASCTNIHEATNEDGSSNRSNSPPIVLEPPLSVQPERKNKSSNLNSLGRL